MVYCITQYTLHLASTLFQQPIVGRDILKNLLGFYLIYHFHHAYYFIHFIADTAKICNSFEFITVFIIHMHIQYNIL